MTFRWLLVGLAIVGAGGYALVQMGAVAIPPHWNPWAPLSIVEPPNLLTRYKLARLDADAAGCRSALGQAQMRYTLLPDRQTGEGCGFVNAVRIDATSARIGEPFALSCRAAVALALWEQHVLQPAAERHYGVRVARIEHYGSYACRNVYGRDAGRRSQHATADAFDVAGFVMANGRSVRVRTGWDGPGAGDGAFLREVHAGACQFFDGVLGPDYNAAHHDHLHLDRGAWRVCR